MCLSLHFIGCVRFAWYHEKMYDCHFFAFGGLTLCWCYIIVFFTEVNLGIVNVLADFRRTNV